MKKVKLKRIGPVLVLTPQASLFGGDEAYELRDAIGECNEEGNRYLIVNLVKAERMNSLGLGFLIDGYKLYSERSARMALCCLHVNPRDLIAASKLTIFDIHDSEEEAIASFIE